MKRFEARTLLAASVASALALAANAGAADKAGCKDPAWAAQRLAGFDIAACGDKAWMSMDVSLPGGGKTLQGALTTVDYNLADPAKSPTNEAARRFFADQGQAAGAKLMSDPNGGFMAVLSRQAPEGDTWYIYKHGNGNDKSTTSFTLITVRIAPLPQEVTARDDATLPGDAAVCKDPPWLAKQFAYFKLESCAAKDFDRVNVEVGNATKPIAGRVYKAQYVLADRSKEPVALAVRDNYVNALKQIGAELVSDARHNSRAVLIRHTAQGEFWYSYEQTGGNENSVGGYRLTTVLIAPMVQEVEARDTTEPLDTQSTSCKDPAWLVKQFAYFKLATCKGRDFDVITLVLPGGQKKALAGHILETNYARADAKKDGVTFVLRDNYVNALQKIGATLVSDPKNIFQAALTRNTPQGEFWYIYEHTTGNDQTTGSYKLTTVQIGGPTPKSCTLEIYGVNFDFDKSTLRPDSEPVLKQVLALLTGDPAYAGEIGGHTDNVGKSDYNRKLSGQRADAVKAWLTAGGVAGTRLSTAGYGDTKPLVPNTTDENRAKNRRVELKRKDCKG